MGAPQPFTPIQFGKYLLVSLIGRGGMAEVYKARMLGAAGFERMVCVKRIRQPLCDDENLLEMFTNEAKLVARLSHPNIVQVSDFDIVDGEFYLAMDYVQGKDLLRVIRAHAVTGALPPPVGAYIAREMCRALAYAHEFVDEEGRKTTIVHRDVSPQNVMISFDGIVKVVDFGIAKALETTNSEGTRTGVLKGKLSYMAPEQIHGAKASPQTDIFAVGITLHEMLTGRRLFKGNSEFDTMNRVKSQPIPPPSQLNPQVPTDLDQIVGLALERNTSLRYQRAALMARDLEQFCGRIGFTSDDMKEFMVKLFPRRDEIPDGVIETPTRSGKRGAGASRPNLAAFESRASNYRIRKSMVARKYWWALPSGIIVAVGIGAGLWLHHRAWRMGAGHGAAGLPVANVETAPPSPVAAPEVTVVALHSDPDKVEVADGPRILGATPLDLRLGKDRPTMTLTMRKDGYEDLVYTVTRNDGPTVMLRLKENLKEKTKASLKAKVPGKRREGGKPSTGEGRGAPTVQSFDDVEAGKSK